MSLRDVDAAQEIGDDPNHGTVSANLNLTLMATSMGQEPRETRGEEGDDSMHPRRARCSDSRLSTGQQQLGTAELFGCVGAEPSQLLHHHPTSGHR